MAKFNKGENQYGNTEQREKRFLELFNKRFSLFEYLSGFTDIDSPVITRCRKCGSIQPRSAQCIRRANSIKCNACVSRDRLKFKRRRDEEARREKLEMKQRRTEEKLAEANRQYTYVCAQCGEEFVSKRKGKKYCSAMCCKRAGYKKREVTRRLRITANGKADWDISIDRLISRDGGVCHICGKRVDLGDYTETGDGVFIAHGQYPSIDHVVPLSLGGTHTWDNVKLAHKSCNETKSNKIFYTTQGGQVVMSVCPPGPAKKWTRLLLTGGGPL